MKIKTLPKHASPKKCSVTTLHVEQLFAKVCGMLRGSDDAVNYNTLRQLKNGAGAMSGKMHLHEHGPGCTGKTMKQQLQRGRRQRRDFEPAERRKI
jgi:hypothetical protein